MEKRSTEVKLKPIPGDLPTSLQGSLKTISSEVRNRFIDAFAMNQNSNREEAAVEAVQSLPPPYGEMKEEWRDYLFLNFAVVKLKRDQSVVEDINKKLVNIFNHPGKYNDPKVLKMVFRLSHEEPLPQENPKKRGREISEEEESEEDESEE